MRKWSALVVCLVSSSFLLLQACSRNLDPQESCNFVQNSSLQRVSWKQNLPVRLFIHKSVPPQYYLAIEAAIESWNSILGQKLLVIDAFGTTGAGPDRDGYSVLYWMDTWEANKPTEQARTTVYWSGSVIYEADIKFNAKNFHFSPTPQDTTAATVDFESLVLHELGHVLGLSHSSLQASVMNKNLANGVKRTSINEQDKESLQCEY